MTAFPAEPLQGEVVIPGDKSISHRALILSAIAQGDAHIKGFLPSEDCLATLHALRACGSDIHHDVALHEVHIRGVGLHGLKTPSHPLDCGNSGTSMRLLAGLLAGQSFASTLIGDNSLSKRPMDRIIQPLKQMQAPISGMHEDRYAPLMLAGIKGHLNPLVYPLPLPSAQVKSCLLLAGLYASGETTIIDPYQTRDHTERMLAAMGADITVDNDVIRLKPGKPLRAKPMTIPGDISSAAFFMAGASMVPGSHILLRNVGVNPKRTGILDILRAMGADIQCQAKPMIGNEPVADITIREKRWRASRCP